MAITRATMRESLTLASGVVSGMYEKTVGKVKANDDNTKQLTLVPAPVALNDEALLTKPEAMNAMPKTRSKFERIEPINDCCTTLTKPALIALIVTIISTALPKVAFKRPPSICPVCAAKDSVAAPNTAAKGTMAMKFVEKVLIGPHSNSPAQMPNGTKTRRMLMGCTKMSLRPSTWIGNQPFCAAWPDEGSLLAMGLESR
mmetsp:Transcript_53971/g.106524  ORF Transcript_53971/g.106524 Transcript_53971/m.106524 type:complete len:201 (+) Transcript_53971:650-1252(+)